MASSRTGVAGAGEPGVPSGAGSKGVLGGQGGGLDEDTAEGLGSQPGRGPGGQSWICLNNKINNDITGL